MAEEKYTFFNYVNGMEPNLLLRTGTLSTEWIIFDIISIPKDFPKIFKNPESFLKFFSSISGDFPNISENLRRFLLPPPPLIKKTQT